MNEVSDAGIAGQDAMTGAMAREGFIAEAARELMRSLRYDRPVSLVLIEVDHLGTVRDKYGERASDAVLVSIANCCMTNMRSLDSFGRLGDTTYCLLLPETGQDEARHAAERMRRLVTATIVQTGAVEIRATVSMGVAPKPAVEGDISAWLGAAEAACMAARRQGGNRVALASQPASPLPATTVVQPDPIALH